MGRVRGVPLRAGASLPRRAGLDFGVVENRGSDAHGGRPSPGRVGDDAGGAAGAVAPGAADAAVLGAAVRAVRGGLRLYIGF